MVVDEKLWKRVKERIKDREKERIKEQGKGRRLTNVSTLITTITHSLLARASTA